MHCNSGMRWVSCGFLAYALALHASSAAGEPASAARRELPAPKLDGGPALTRVLATRRSIREFASRDLDDAEVGQLVWAAQGALDGHRTAPSAGALYPLTVHVCDARGVWRYLPAEHALVRESATDRRADVANASLGQDAVRNAPVLIVITAQPAITARKYGKRADRFIAIEAGHAAQNVLLAATALDLAAVPVGAIDDTALLRTLGLSSAHVPLYVIPVGARATH
jgi:SagB-type dehydrogenase family enzyme